MIPLILMYFGIYLLAFTFSWGIAESIHTHLVILLGIFVVLLGYVFAFFWKNDVFFDISRFHLIFSYMTLFIIGVYYFFYRDSMSVLDPVFSLVVLGFSVFFFSYEKKWRREVFHFFLLSLFFVYEILLLFFFPGISLVFLVGFGALLAVLLFENVQENNFFGPFLESSRVFFLSSLLVFSGVLVGLVFLDFSAVYFLLPIMVFLFSVHIRFQNIISYGGAIFLLYFLYGFLCISLLSVNSLVTTLLFIFLFPAILIGNTYFWEEKQSNDFMILHYSSIAFSLLFFVYSLIFVFWNTEILLLFTAFSVFLLAFLFILSYFRFHTR